MGIFVNFQMKTVSVALVVCLNVGVDPPDVVKIQPCAKLETWIGNVLLLVCRRRHIDILSNFYCDSRIM